VLSTTKLIDHRFLSNPNPGAIFTPLSIGPTVEEDVVIDHPFMGFIYDTKAELILFIFRKTKF
jgi:serine protease inhibitor